LTRVFLESFGCSSNVADGEFMTGCLLRAGFEVVEGADEADVLIYNTCAVKSPTENRMFEILGRVPRDKKLVVAGCLPLINPGRLRTEVGFDGLLGPASGFRVVEVVRGVERGEHPIWLDANAKPPGLDLPRSPKNPVVSIVPVAYGCLGSCSYCCVVFARGRLRSYSLEEVVARARRDLASGAREVWLAGQDMGCYGRDLGTNLVELLKGVCSVEGDFFVRVGMMTPNYVREMLNDLIEAYENERVFKFLHLPVQSGDDEVLLRMRRFYTAEDFKNIVHTFREKIPNITVATDVICGFPGETEVEFRRTERLIEDVKPDIVNVSKFFPRPRTPAERMGPRVLVGEVKERSRRMADLVRRIALEKNRAWIGWEGRVLIDERGKKLGSWVGRNFAYKPVVVKSEDDSLLGKFVNARVAGAFQTYLEAEIV